MKNLIIIGGSDAGISAALRARELKPEIVPTIVVADNFPNFSICGLPYYISGEIKDWKNLAHRTKQDIEKDGINLLLEHTAQSIDKDKKNITVVDKTGAIKILDYDKLIIGTGAVSLKPNIPGLDNKGVFFLRWMPECFAIDEFIKKQKPKTAVIIGAGYIGMEMCEALTKRGIKVFVVEFLESVLPSVDADFGNKILNILNQNGITVYNKVAVQSVNEIDNKLLIKGTDNFEILTDMVLVAVGSNPNTKLGKSTGIETGIKGAFKVNLKISELK